MSADFRDGLVDKLKALTETLWHGAADWPSISAWLDNFEPGDDPPSERLHALFLLSQFMYFGSREMRELLKALFRDLYRYPIIEGLRTKSGDSINCEKLNEEFGRELQATRFLGIGNPSESGSHLLYYFRQENRLARELFLNSFQLFTRVAGSSAVVLRDGTVKHYVFVDDFCGSGTQAVEYSREIVADLKVLNPAATVSYFSLFATTSGLCRARTETEFDRVASVFELDESFRCFGLSSRYFRSGSAIVSKDAAAMMAESHGRRLWPAWPLGYKNGQLLIGFFHNVPDNTLPIVWQTSQPAVPWSPIFRRYPKID